MDKKKLIWTAVAVASLGAVASNFLYEHDNSKIWCQAFHSNGFAFVSGLAVYSIVYKYYIK